jgi:hypothetical protein
MEIKMNNNQVVIKDRNNRVCSKMKINENAKSNNVPSEKTRTKTNFSAKY